MAKKEIVKAKKTKDAEKPVKKVAAKKVVAKKAAAPKKVAAKKAVAKKAVAKKAAKPAKKAANPETALLDSIVEGILDRKGRNIVVLDLRPAGNGIADFFVICHGTSNTQAAAIANSVEERVRKDLNIKPWHTEGFQNAEWILTDYVNVVVHVFQEPIRDFYRLEDLWADAPVTKIEESFNH